MNAAPRLSESDIRSEVERIFRKDHRSKLVALFGKGEPGRFDYDGGTWEVLPTSCELELRARLPRPGEIPAGRVFLVDWEEETLPLDIQCRLAGGRLFHIARDARLLALFGARHIDSSIATTALARLLLSGAVEGVKKVSGLKLTRDDAWKRFLSARLGIEDDVVSSPAALFRWARTSSDAGPAFVRQCDADVLWGAVRRELHAWLDAKLGPAGLLAFRAWEAGQVERVLQVLVLSHVGGGADEYLRGLLGGHVAAWLPALAPELRAAQAAVADADLLPKLLDVKLDADLRLLRGSEQLATAAGLTAACASNEWLPAGHAAREQAFAEALDAFLAQPAEETLGVLLEALERLKAHRLDSTERGDDHREGRLMAVRLCTWLLARKVRPPLAPHGTVWQPAVELAARYAEEGGFFDWARASVRAVRGASGPLETALKRLLARLDVEASSDDRRFAEAYVAWLEAGKPSGDVVPIEHVVKRVMAPFLRGNDRKLLVVLMDGMSQAAAAQVLVRLEEERRWRPLAWHTPGWKGTLGVPPVLAVAPTLTDVSRSALFAGKADPRFGDQGTDKDAARWTENAQRRELVGDGPAAFFVRRDLLAGHELIDEVKNAIGGDDRVVAVIVNAVDEHLKGSIQVAVDYSRVAVTTLEALLDAARGAERAVLLVADHGHVRGDAMRVVSGRIGGDRQYGARWRALLEGEQPEADEVRLPETCWRPRASAGIAVLWNTNVAFKAPHLGEHGGLSLMETVAPAMLIGPDWLDRAVGDPELSTRELPLPPWWELRIPRAPSAPVVAPSLAKSATQVAQLQLLSVPAAVAAQTNVEPPLVVSLRSSKAFKEHTRGQPERELELVLGWLSALVREGGSVATADFARSCGVRPHQVGGVVARMGILNADGFAIVEHDVVGRRVVLHRARLEQQYGVRE